MINCSIVRAAYTDGLQKENERILHDDMKYDKITDIIIHESIAALTVSWNVFSCTNSPDITGSGNCKDVVMRVEPFDATNNNEAPTEKRK